MAATSYLTDLDGDYMAEFVDRNADKPFFLYFSPFAVHSKVENTPQHYRDRIPGGNGNAYEGAVVAVDDAVGKLLAMLRKHDIEDDTLILFTGDNGANRREGGSSEPYRGGKGPDTQQEGRRLATIPIYCSQRKSFLTTSNSGTTPRSTTFRIIREPALSRVMVQVSPS